MKFINLLVSPKWSPAVPCTSVVLSVVLLLFQVGRRFMECCLISVFTGKIHVAHYLVGLLFYALAGLSLSAPLLSRTGPRGLYTRMHCTSCSSRNFPPTEEQGNYEAGG